jgi:hypothetical protein
LGNALGPRFSGPPASGGVAGRCWQAWLLASNGVLLLPAPPLSLCRYRSCGEADAIRAAIAVQETDAARQEEQRQVAEEVRRLLAAGEPIPEHLLPASAKEPQDKKGGKKEAGGKKGKK